MIEDQKSNLKSTKINGHKILYYPKGESLTEKEHQPLIKKWLIDNVIPCLTKTIDIHHSSYQLKHVIENELGFYVNNYDIKYHMAMLNIPFIQDDDSPNCNYPISKKFWKKHNHL